MNGTYTCLSYLALLGAVHCGGSTAQSGTIPDAAADLEGTMPDGDVNRLDAVRDDAAEADSVASRDADGRDDVDARGDVELRADADAATVSDVDSSVDGDAPEVASDVHADADAPTDTDAAMCCPISPAPACCMQYGGSPDHFGCGTVCDGMPGPGYPGWERRIDENGCPYWWTPPGAPPGCGVFPPDVRTGG
jgi:hypothetical protein